jgi:hypothetical protein
MQQFKAYYVGVLFLLMPLYANVVSAEIYKWVDADGNVHFGDKPRDATVAREAEPVDVTEDYRPPARSEEEQAAFERELETKRQKKQKRELARKEVTDKEADKRRQEKAALCKRYADNIGQLTKVDASSGIRTYTYLTGEDGKSITSARQREIVEELKAEMAAAGCS